MPLTTLIDELRSLLCDAAVVSDPSELLVYESDGFTIAKARPRAVVFPTSTAEVIEVVKLLNRHDVQIVPRGSGTGLAGGCVAFDGGVIVSTSRMNRILRIDIENRIALVQAGVRNTQLSEAVWALPGGEGLHFAPDPSSQRASTMTATTIATAEGCRSSGPTWNQRREPFACTPMWGTRTRTSRTTAITARGRDRRCRRW